MHPAAQRTEPLHWICKFYAALLAPWWDIFSPQSNKKKKILRLIYKFVPRVNTPKKKIFKFLTLTCHRNKFQCVKSPGCWCYIDEQVPQVPPMGLAPIRRLKRASSPPGGTWIPNVGRVQFDSFYLDPSLRGCRWKRHRKHVNICLLMHSNIYVSHYNKCIYLWCSLAVYGEKYLENFFLLYLFETSRWLVCKSNGVPPIVSVNCDFVHRFRPVYSFWHWAWAYVWTCIDAHNTLMPSTWVR